MNSVHPHLLRLSISQAPKYLTIFSHVSTTTTTNTTTTFDTQLNAQSSTNHEHPESPAKAIPTQLSNCANLLELNQIFAHIIRTHFLQLYPAPFYWNNIIRSYTRLEAPNKALCVYISMSKAGVLPDCYTLPIILKAVSQAFATGFGRQLHSVAIRVGLEYNEYCESGFISLYCKAGGV